MNAHTSCHITNLISERFTTKFYIWLTNFVYKINAEIVFSLTKTWYSYVTIIILTCFDRVSQTIQCPLPMDFSKRYGWFMNDLTFIRGVVP